MKRISAAFGLVVLLAIVSAPSPAADQGRSKQFACRLLITSAELDTKGMPKKFAPTLVVRDGQDAKFLSGGELPTIGGDPVVEFGLQATIRVHEISPEQLRVTFSATNGDLENATDSRTIIRETGVRCRLMIKPGESFDVDLGGGRKITAVITPLS